MDDVTRRLPCSFSETESVHFRRLFNGNRILILHLRIRSIIQIWKSLLNLVNELEY